MGEGIYTNPSSDKECAATEERGGKNLKVAYSHLQCSTHFSSPVQVLLQQITRRCKDSRASQGGAE